MNQAAAPAAGVRFLRNMTLRRSFRSYAEWIGKSVGWWTIAYLIFWLVIFAISGIELLGVLEEPIALPLGTIMSTILTFVFGSLIYRARAAPVFVNRRDVYRLVLGPAAPYQVLRWPFVKVWLMRGVIGLLIGTVWAVVAPYWLHHSAWFAGPALALILISLVNLAWIRYWHLNNPEADARYLFLLLGATALALLGVFVPEAGLLGAFVSGSPLTLIAPLLVAGASAYFVHRTLLSSYPPRFAAQSFVLSELGAMRQMNILAAMAGVAGSDDPAYRARLLATLHDKPGVTKPSRSLPLPRPGSAQWQAINWRTLTMLYRRPLLAQLRLLFQFAAVVVGSIFAAQAGSFGLLMLSLVMANLAGFLLGTGGYARQLPIRGAQRTLGRALAAAVVAWLAATIGYLLGPLFLGAVPPGQLALITVVLLSTVVWLEKYSTWTGAPARRMEAWVVAALLASAPALLLTAFGAPGLVMPVQFGILALLLILDA